MNQELNMVVMPNGSLQLEWVKTTSSVNKSSILLQKEIFKRFNTNNNDNWLLFLGFCNKQVQLSPSLDFLRSFARLFCRALRQTPDLETSRNKTIIDFSSNELSNHLMSAPLMTGSEYLSLNLLEFLWTKLNTVFNREIDFYKGTVQDFIKNYSPDTHLIGRIFFHLVENKNSEYPFAFLATYSTKLSKHGKSKHLPLKYALQEYKNDNEKLLELLNTVYLVAKKSTLIAALIQNGQIFHPLAWTASEAHMFLKENVLYENLGILCRIPEWWKTKTRRVNFKIKVGERKPSHVNMNSVLSLNPVLSFGNMEISIGEAKRLLNRPEGLNLIRNKWIVVSHKKLRQALDTYEKANKLITNEELSFKDALCLQLNPKKLLDVEDSKINFSISNGEWLESVFQKLTNPHKLAAVKPDISFKAKLRKYQQTGLDWLYYLNEMQFGACLADDMGLGKTVQLLALLSFLKSKLKSSKKKKKPSLLIIPASLISNWVNEITKFTPQLDFFIAHPTITKPNEIQQTAEKYLNRFDIVITTYTLVQKFEWIKKNSWQIIILDEAQAIKNAMTKQSKAIKCLKGPVKL